MYKRKIEPEYKTLLELGLKRLGGKWELRILCVLTLYGKLRYSQLKEKLPGISEAALSLALKNLTESNIVHRYQQNSKPMIVEYELSEDGKTAVLKLRDFCQWTNKQFSNNALPEICKLCLKANPQTKE